MKKYKGLVELSKKHNITYEQAEYCMDIVNKVCTNIVTGKK